jgi:hypothetical protein
MPIARFKSQEHPKADPTFSTPAAMSTFFVRRMHHHTQQPMPWRHWLKWLIVIDVERQLILAQNARQAPWNDCASLPTLVAEAHQHTPVGCVLADAEFNSERNHRFCREQLQAKCIIPAKRFTSRRTSGFRLQMRENFPCRGYRRRNLIESVFSTIKRKLSSRALGGTLATQIRQALLLGVAYNLYRLKPSIFRKGCQQSQMGSRVTPARLGREKLQMIRISSANQLCSSAFRLDSRPLAVLHGRFHTLLPGAQGSPPGCSPSRTALCRFPAIDFLNRNKIIHVCQS